jgi:predicted ferric reductase
MGTWEAVTWAVARAGGLTAFILLALAVIAGLALSLRLQSPRWPRLINNELHNFLTLLAAVFTSVHVLAVLVDPYTRFGLNEVLIPLASHYRPVWVALGIVALYLGIAIGIRTLLRPLIGYVLWRRLHILTLVLWGLVTVHGLTAGSDAASWWARTIYLASVAVVGYLLIRRSFGANDKPAEQAIRPASSARPQQSPNMTDGSVAPQTRQMPLQPTRPRVGTSRVLVGASTGRPPRNDHSALEAPRGT